LWWSAEQVYVLAFALHTSSMDVIKLTPASVTRHWWIMNPEPLFNSVLRLKVKSGPLLTTQQLWWAKELHNTKYYNIINFFTLLLHRNYRDKKTAMSVAPLHAWLVIIVHIKHSMSEMDCSFFYSMPSTRCLTQRTTLRRQVLNVMYPFI